MSFNMASDKGRVVVVECDSIRDIKPGELIHYVKTSEHHIFRCLVCDQYTPTAWTDDQEVWQRSVSRCL